LNIKAAYLHMAADALVSVGVVIAGILILFTGWLWLDPLISLVIVAVVFVVTWKLLKDSAHLAIDGVPAHIRFDDVETWLLELPGVESVHDLHIWGTARRKLP
jgi:cation diffusion facilitator family transporter